MAETHTPDSKPERTLSDEERKAHRAKKKELLELRIRGKLANEQFKAASAGRKELKARTQALMSELGMERRKGGEGGQKQLGPRGKKKRGEEA